jgi:hypothetical protein
MSTQLFTDLAGSQFLTIPSNLNKSEVLDIITKYKIIFQNKIKVIFDNSDPILIADSFMDPKNNLSYDASISPYNSNFFILDKMQSTIWLDKNPFIGFKIKQILFENKEEVELIKNLIINSFAIKITKGAQLQTIIEGDEIRAKSILAKFDQSFLQPSLKTFLVKSDLDEIVGCYSLIKIGNEVQLSGVAGRTALENSYKGKKLVVLCQAMISSFLTESEFGDVNYLTLSNSKKPVAQMYRDLDIPENHSRKGLLVEF